MAFLLLWRLDRPAYLFDEQLYAAKGWEYVHPGTAPWTDITRGNFEHPPLAKQLYGLAQLVLSDPQGVVASRVLASLATLTGAGMIGLLVDRVAGRGWGLMAGVSFVILPTAVYPQVTHVGRSALLDTVAVPFVMAAAVCSCAWLQASSSRAAWWAATGVGLATGLATACKENGFLASVGLVIAVVLARRRTWRREMMRAGVAALTCLMTYVVTFLPFDDPLARIWYLVDYQRAHSSTGHPVGIAGVVYEHPPWWGNLWFAGQALGPVLVTVVGVGVLLGLIARSRAVGLMLAGLVGPFVFHCFVAGVALGFYWYLWWPLALTAAVVGLAQARRAASRLRVPIRGGRAVQLVAVTLILVLGVGTTARVLALPVEGGNAVVAARRAAGLTGRVLAAGVYPVEIVAADRGMRISTKARPDQLREVDTLVVGAPRCRTVYDRQVLALIRSAVDRGAAVRIDEDRLFTTYQVVGRLEQPSAEQVSAIPARAPADGC